MKIAHLFQSPGLNFAESGAAQVHIYYTIRGLQRAGHYVVLVALYDKRQALCTNDKGVFGEEIPLENFIGKLGWSGDKRFKLLESGFRRFQTEASLPYLGLFDSYRMYDACCQNIQGFDLIHERYNLFALGGALASRRLGIPLVLEINADLFEQRKLKGNPEKGLSKAYATWATRFVFGTAKRIVCISQDLKSHLMKKWRISEKKLDVLPCAADVDEFGKTYNLGLVRKKFGLVNEPVVMWVGGFYKWHILDFLLDSFSIVLEKCRNAKLVLVGDGDTRPIIESKIREKALVENVIMTGRIYHKQVSEILSIADVTVVTSSPASADQGGTGTPLKLFEYMAAGKPIIATDVNHTCEVIRHGHNGLLFKFNDEWGFANAIVSLLQDPSERSRLGRNARSLALEQFSWEHYTTQLEAIYSSIC